MSDNDQNSPVPGPSGQQGKPVDATRRRLGQAALGAVPVLLAMRHRPVRAAWACHSPSGFSSMSLNTSYQPNEPQFCQGRSPGYWVNHPDNWPAGFNPALKAKDGGTRFVEAFGGGGAHFNVSNPNNLTMMRVLTLKGYQDPQQMGAHFVAALLNAAAGMTDPLKPYTVRNMWQEFAATGSYSPPPGVDRWDAVLIKGYFESTWA